MVIKQRRTDKPLAEAKPLVSVASLMAVSPLDLAQPLLCVALFLRHFKAISREASRNCPVPSDSRSTWP